MRTMTNRCRPAVQRLLAAIVLAIGLSGTTASLAQSTTGPSAARNSKGCVAWGAGGRAAWAMCTDLPNTQVRAVAKCPGGYRYGNWVNRLQVSSIDCFGYGWIVLKASYEFR